MTPTFRDRPWNQRFAPGGMGEEAEQEFEAWCFESKRGFVRYGLDRPPIQMHALPAFVRYTPDYLMSKHLVEVQGFGRDQKFKLKADKYQALLEWSAHHPVKLFAWDRTNARRFMAELRHIRGAIETDDRVGWGMFSEGKPYYEFTADLLAEIGEEV